MLRRPARVFPALVSLLILVILYRDTASFYRRPAPLTLISLLRYGGERARGARRTRLFTINLKLNLRFIR